MIILKDRRIRIFLISVFVLLILFSPSFYFYNKYQKVTKLLNSQKTATESEVESLIKKVSQIIVLPEGETPTVATVTDKNKVNNQLFFAKSENGDKALIYTQAKKAILYRPSINKIIEVSLISSTPITPVVKPTIEEKIKVAIYNGSDINDRVNITEKQITDKFPQIEVVKKVSAGKTYPRTLVIDLKGNQRDLVKKIADYILGEMTSFPQNEATPEADILIILGWL